MLIYLLIFFTLVGIYLLTARHGGCNNKLFFIIMMAVALFVGLSDMLGGMIVIFTQSFLIRWQMLERRQHLII